MPKRRPGVIRDAIVSYLSEVERDASVGEITQAVEAELGQTVAPSSVRSYLRLGDDLLTRTARGRYRLAERQPTVIGDGVATYGAAAAAAAPAVAYGSASLFQDDCLSWLATRAPNSIHAVVTDPPYGLVEYSGREQAKLRAGRGGVWRLPPSFDGHVRSPVPRFTVLSDRDLARLESFFLEWARALYPVLVPGANVLVASNPLVSYRVAAVVTEAGFERRGEIVRRVMTMRGGDRPKNAHEEFPDVSVMPRSMWEPWLTFRKPLDGRVQDNLRKWGVGGFRRISADRPFGDVIDSGPHAAGGALHRAAPQPQAAGVPASDRAGGAAAGGGHRAGPVRGVGLDAGGRGGGRVSEHRRRGRSGVCRGRPDGDPAARVAQCRART